MSKNILLVDNDKDFINLNKKAIELAGFQVSVASSAAEALNKLDNSKPDLIITELMLEHSDSGFSLCHNISKKHPGIPIIILSDVVRKTGIQFELNTREEKEWINANEFIDKPISQSSLISRINRYFK